MATANPRIFLGTVLLEPNRWTPDKLPTFKVSDWAPAIRDAGFDGIELWENHAALADPDEQAALLRLPLPVPLFNSYCTFDDAGADTRRRAIDFVVRFGARGVKFNLGNDTSRTAEYLRNLDAWLGALPAGCRPLCECHGGTVLETPAEAARLLAPFRGRVEIIVHPFAIGYPVLREWLDRFGPAVTHIHSAARTRGGPMVCLRDLEESVLDRLAQLKAAGFSGSWTVEFTGGVARSPEDRSALLANAAQDMTFLRRHYGVPPC